jgi:predicted transposase YdaD
MGHAITWCIENNILRGFFETHGSEVVNMLMTEWKLEDALVVEREEGWEEGLEEGLEQGLEKGRKEGLEEGLEKGLEKGLERGREEIAKAALAKGMSPEAVGEITGLDPEKIKKLAGR